MPRCSTDGPPMPLDARSMNRAVMIAAAANRATSVTTAGTVGPWNGCCPRTDSHSAP